MSLMDMLGLRREEEPVEEPVEEPQVETPQYATVEQMQQLVQGVASQLQENLVGLVQGRQQPVQQEPTYQAPHEPSLDEIAEAWEMGETKKALQLQAQRDQARDYRYSVEFNRIRQEGAQAFSDVNSQLLGSAVPDYKKFEKDVAKKMDELGLGKEFRTNPKIVKLITDAVKGEKFDDLYQERIEAQKRQENDAAQGEVASRRSNRLPAEQKQVFSAEAERALRMGGVDKEQFAKKRGYGSWKDYEDNAAAFVDYRDNGGGSYVPKWRRNK